MSRLDTLTRATKKDLADGMHSLNMLSVIKNLEKRHSITHLFTSGLMRSKVILKGIQSI